MPERIRPRRPIAWNQLLTKGHAHQKVRSAQRRQQKQVLESEIDEYFLNAESEPEGKDSQGKDARGSSPHLHLHQKTSLYRRTVTLV